MKVNIMQVMAMQAVGTIPVLHGASGSFGF